MYHIILTKQNNIEVLREDEKPRRGEQFVASVSKDKWYDIEAYCRNNNIDLFGIGADMFRRLMKIV